MKIKTTRLISPRCRPAGEFGLKLYRLRRRAGLRQADVAQLVHRNINTIARWERGEVVPDTLVREVVLRRLRDLKQAAQSARA